MVAPRAALRAAGPKAEAPRPDDGSDFTFEIHESVLMQVTAPLERGAVRVTEAGGIYRVVRRKLGRAMST